MTERYLLDVFGRPERRPSHEEAGAVFRTLEEIWVRTLYGEGGSRSAHTSSCGYAPATTMPSLVGAKADHGQTAFGGQLHRQGVGVAA
jgi:hypothetical protein